MCKRQECKNRVQNADTIPTLLPIINLPFQVVFGKEKDNINQKSKIILKRISNQITMHYRITYDQLHVNPMKTPLSNFWNRVPWGQAIKVMTFLKALQWCRVDLYEQVIASKNITKMSLTFLETLQRLSTWESHWREQPNFPPQEPSQAWNFKLESPPYRHPFEPEPAPWFPNIPLFNFFIIKTTIMSKSLVRKKLG